ncbi:MAG: hypothetical protein KDD01_08935, partial [Phaeodactylibacter sp.]|nr:hypothetical protein [Phaeodactylibacter sp.]
MRTIVKKQIVQLFGALGILGNAPLSGKSEIGSRETSVLRSFRTRFRLPPSHFRLQLWIALSPKFFINLLIACLVALPAGTALGQAPANDDGAGAKYHWSESLLKQKPEWYTTAEAREIAGNVLLYQTDAGAWPKNTNLAEKPPSSEYLEKVRTGKEANTIDNKATTTPMRYLALMTQATGEAKYKKSFLRGLDYLLAAQYANGGWPQFYPLRDRGYYSEITYNDNAMMNVLFLLRDVAEGENPYE